MTAPRFALSTHKTNYSAPSRAQSKRKVQVMSFQKCFKTNSMPYAARVVASPYDIAVEYPEMWRAYLISYYGGDAALIQAEFGCTIQTAYNWLAARGEPKASKVEVDRLKHPGRWEEHRTRWLTERAA